MALGIDLQLDATPADVPRRAKELAAAGVRGLFTFEGKHDIFLPLGIAASHVQTDFMTNVAIAMPRSPIHLAHASWDLQTLSQGRFRLGLGSQVKAHIVHRFGSSWDKPAAQMRDKIEAVKAVFDCWQNGTPLRYEGRYTRLSLMAPAFNPGPSPFGPPPILLGGLGPLMVRTAAEVADGVLVMPFNSARHFRERTLPAVAEGLSRRTDGKTSVEVQPAAIVGLAPSEADRAAAELGVRKLLGFYGSTPAYRPVLEVEGYGELQPELNALIRRGDYDTVPTLFDDELTSRLAVVGTPAEIAVQLQNRFGAAAQRVCCYFPYQEPTIDAMAALVDACAAVAA